MAPKIKAVIEKIKTKSDQPSAVLSSKAKIRRIKMIKKHKKSYDSEDSVEYGHKKRKKSVIKMKKELKVK